MSLATYVRLSLELVCSLDALLWYLKDFMLNMGQQQPELLSHRRVTQEVSGDPRLSSLAQQAAVNRAFQHCSHQVFLSWFIYFWVPFNSKQKQSDNYKIRLCHVGTTIHPRKTLSKLCFIPYKLVILKLTSHPPCMNQGLNETTGQG